MTGPTDAAADSEIVVRVARADDFEAALALAPRLGEGVAAWRDPVEVQQAVARWVRESFDRGAEQGRTVFVAELGGVVVGFVAAEVKQHWSDGRDAYIGELAVRPDVERRGVGRALVEAVADWARGRGLAHLTLDTGAANHRARRFYAGLGFAVEDVRLTTPL